MKFSQHLQAHLTPEWRKQYIHYARLKGMIYDAVLNAPSEEGFHGESVYFEEVERTYMQQIGREVEKIESFFKSKEAEAESSFLELEGEVKRLVVLSAVHGTTVNRRVAARWGKTISVVDGRGEDMESSRAVKRKSMVILDDNDRPGAQDELEEEVKLSSPEIGSRLKSMKLAFSEYYLSLILLQQYQQLNKEGFRKILKKHDKEWKTDGGLQYFKEVLVKSYFVQSKKIEDLILKTETIVIEDLESGNRRQAMNRLRVPPLETRYSHVSSYGLGLFMGMSIVLIVFSIVIGVYLTELESHNCGNETHPVKCNQCWRLNGTDWCELDGIVRTRNGMMAYDWGDWVPALRMFRVSLFISLMVFFVGVNTYGWRANGVNHVLVFEIDPRNYLSSFQLMEIGSFMLVMWLCGLLSYYAVHHFGSPDYAHFCPITVIVMIVSYTVFPFKLLHWRSRTWFLRILKRIVLAPFCTVKFPDFWIADQMNSLAGVLVDVEFTLCFFAYDWQHNQGDAVCTSVQNGIIPIIACLPAWFRFAQCLRRYGETKKFFPHAVNAGKYSTTFLVVLFSSLYKAEKERGAESQEGALFTFWILACILNFCYTLWWDMYMDWGVLDREYSFLREELVYPHKLIYYAAIIEDAVFRLFWIFKVSLLESKKFRVEVLITIFGLVEIFRRFIWNFFRLENEHLNNTGEFRAVRDIKITPLYTLFPQGSDKRRSISREQGLDNLVTPVSITQGSDRRRSTSRERGLGNHVMPSGSNETTL